VANRVGSRNRWRVVSFVIETLGGGGAEVSAAETGGVALAGLVVMAVAVRQRRRRSVLTDRADSWFSVGPSMALASQCPHPCRFRSPCRPWTPSSVYQPRQRSARRLVTKLKIDISGELRYMDSRPPVVFLKECNHRMATRSDRDDKIIIWRPTTSFSLATLL
jgi:uncharacterized protein (TIGR03382 family)